MKKVFIYFFVFLLIFFLLPALLTKKNVEAKVSDNKEINATEEEKVENYDYKNYGTIKLLHLETNEVEEVPIDTYLVNVVSAEMPADFEIEALKAQSVVARTYTIYKIQNKKHDNADICDDSGCCQAWISKEERLARWDEGVRGSNWQKIEQAVNGTKGKIIIYEGKPINAFFHSNSGGKTEVPVNVWGGTGYPYLQVVETSGEDNYTQYNSEVVLSKEELLEKLKVNYSDISIDFNNNDDLKILEYTDSGRVKTVKFGNHNLSGTETRSLFGLRSTNFEIIKENDNIKFSVKGYGHGVGMSQTGANTLAKEGKFYEDIIKHFYIGVEIQDINNL